MDIFVPATNIKDITRYCLKGYDYTTIQVGDDDRYWRYLSERWSEGKTFINVEQDVVFWPGALESLWNCPHYWCVFGYGMLGVLNHPRQWPPLGLVKFRENFIEDTKNIWNEVDHDWRHLDGNLAQWITDHDVLGYHQHYPGIINYHPDLL